MGPGVLRREKDTSKKENGRIEKERHESNKKERDTMNKLCGRESDEERNKEKGIKMKNKERW